MFSPFWQHAESCSSCERFIWKPVSLNSSWSCLTLRSCSRTCWRSNSWCPMVQLWNEILCDGTANNTSLYEVTKELCYFEEIALISTQHSEVLKYHFGVRLNKYEAFKMRRVDHGPQHTTIMCYEIVPEFTLWREWWRFRVTWCLQTSTFKCGPLR